MVVLAVLRRSFSRWFVILGVLGAVPAAVAEESFSPDAVKAAYLYRFTGYVEWGQSVPAGAPFTIAVYKGPGVAQNLRQVLAQHRIANAFAQVVEINQPRDLGSAQMLYMGPGYAKTMTSLLSRGVHSVLLVTDEERGLDAGAVINFLSVDNRVRFEVSLDAADRMGVKLDAGLLSVAVRVQGAHGPRPAHAMDMPTVQRAVPGADEGAL